MVYVAPVPKVVVYVPTEEWRALETRGEEPAAWVRALVKGALPEPGAGLERGSSDGSERSQDKREVAGSIPARGPSSSGSVSVPDEDEEEERVVKGCLDHRGDPDEFCEACLAMEVS